jgi:hypothetical protein
MTMNELKERPMAKATTAVIAHTADEAKEAILNFWMPGKNIESKNERKLRKILAAFSTLKLEKVMNDVGLYGEIRRLVAQEAGLLSSDQRRMLDVTYAKIGHAADTGKEAILNFWMPGGVINHENEMKLRKALATIDPQKLEIIMNDSSKHKKKRLDLAKKVDLLSR